MTRQGDVFRISQGANLKPYCIMTEAVQDYVRIKLTQGKYTLIDRSDLELVGKFKWHFDSSTGYARRREWDGGRNHTMSIHQIIMNWDGVGEVDHINGDKLDNTRSNLRIITSQQNKWNTGLFANSSSGVKGVYPRETKSGIRYDVRLSMNDTAIHVGSFQSLEDAIEAHRVRGIELRGEFYTLARGPKKDFALYPIVETVERINPSSSGYPNVHKVQKGSKYYYLFTMNKTIYRKSGFPTAVLASLAVEAKIKELRP